LLLRFLGTDVSTGIPEPESLRTRGAVDPKSVEALPRERLLLR